MKPVAFAFTEVGSNDIFELFQYKDSGERWMKLSDCVWDGVLQPLVILTPELQELVEAAKEWDMDDTLSNPSLGEVLDSRNRLRKAVKAFEESAKEKS